MSSATTGADGILYDLTNDAVAAGRSRYSTDAIVVACYSANAHVQPDAPGRRRLRALVMQVDGVENVIGGTGRRPAADRRDRSRQEQHASRVTWATTGSSTRTTSTSRRRRRGRADRHHQGRQRAASLGGTDTVTMTGGRVGLTPRWRSTRSSASSSSRWPATRRQSTRENDVLDVTAMTAGAIVDYINGDGPHRCTGRHACS